MKNHFYRLSGYHKNYLFRAEKPKAAPQEELSVAGIEKEVSGALGKLKNQVEKNLNPEEGHTNPPKNREIHQIPDAPDKPEKENKSRKPQKPQKPREDLWKQMINPPQQVMVADNKSAESFLKGMEQEANKHFGSIESGIQTTEAMSDMES